MQQNIYYFQGEQDSFASIHAEKTSKCHIFNEAA